MRWQVLAGALAVGLLTVAPVFATPIDFSTDPSLGTGWTQYYFYNAFGRDQVTSAWSQPDQNLSLTATTEEGLGGLFRTGDTRSGTDGVTVTYSNYTANTPTDAGNWTCAGLVVSSGATPGIFDDPAGWYGVYFQQDYKGMRFAAGKGLSTELGRITLSSIPSTIKLDVLREGAEWVFKANGAEIARDSSFTSSEMPHYMMYWGGGAADTLSVSADNYGVVPEPASIVILVAGAMSLVCYAWRKRR